MPIKLSGLAFDTTIISELENNLIQEGFNLSEFAFYKQRKARPSASYGLGIEYDYMVSVFGKSFSVPFSDDLEFARFFYNLCLASEDDSDEHKFNLIARVLHRAEHAIEVTKHWLLKDQGEAKHE